MRELPGRTDRTVLEQEPLARTRGNLKRQQIMRATGELVAEGGYGKVRIEQIKERAHVSFKTFYDLFENKEEAFLAFFDQVVLDVTERVRVSQRQTAGQPWGRRVVLAIEEIFAFVAEDPIGARACVVEAPSAGAVVSAHYREALASLGSLFEEGREARQGQAKLPKTLEETTAGSIAWSIRQRLIAGEADAIADLVPEVVEFALRPYLGEAEAKRWAQSPRDEIAVN